ncbi:MAG: RNA methyltransferase [Bacteroidaceae bacterium]|nr:RNA methyltransferase [Bacteroidaceae bacterium]
MISKNKIKYIHSLELKKNRKEEHVFVAEGPKLVHDLLPYFHCRLLVASPNWLAENPTVEADEKLEATAAERAKCSFLKSPQSVLAIFEQPNPAFDPTVVERSLCLALDDVQDPGNLGTIIRLADWFGITDIFCSSNTVDLYNPKTIQATMGAISRVRVHYCGLKELIKGLPNAPIYGTFLEGNNLYQEKLSTHGLIVMGNEGNGISKEIEELVNQRLYIPNYPLDCATSESLNVAMATAIICSEFRRISQ